MRRPSALRQAVVLKNLLSGYVRHNLLNMGRL